MSPESNGWSRYEEKVFYQLDQLDLHLKELDNKVDKLREDVVVLKTKAWAFGIIGGALVTVVFEFILKFMGK